MNTGWRTLELGRSSTGGHFRQRMRFPSDVVFASGALLMVWNFIVKLRPLYRPLIERGGRRARMAAYISFC